MWNLLARGFAPEVDCGIAAPSGRASYRPYRQASAEVMAILRAQPELAVVEVASIDEAFAVLADGLTFGDAPRVAENIRAQIRDKVGHEDCHLVTRLFLSGLASPQSWTSW